MECVEIGQRIICETGNGGWSDGTQALVTLLAVLVGATASAIGTVVVGRRGQRRQRRFDLFELVGSALRELRLPPMTEPTYLTAAQLSVIRDVGRLAVLTGREDYEMAEKINREAEKFYRAEQAQRPPQIQWYIDICLGLQSMQDKLAGQLRYDARRRAAKWWWRGRAERIERWWAAHVGA